MNGTLGKIFGFFLFIVLGGTLWWGNVNSGRVETRIEPAHRKTPVSLPAIENFSKVQSVYLQGDALYVDTKSGTPSAIQSQIADQAAESYLSSHKTTEFLHVYVLNDGAHAFAAVYDGGVAGKER
jgi:hypothetical protein